MGRDHTKNITIAIITLRETAQNYIHNNENTREAVDKAEKTWYSWGANQIESYNQICETKGKITKNERNKEILKRIRRSEANLEEKLEKIFKVTERCEFNNTQDEEPQNQDTTHVIRG